jgi:hypothetical protein
VDKRLPSNALAWNPTNPVVGSPCTFNPAGITDLDSAITSIDYTVTGGNDGQTWNITSGFTNTFQLTFTGTSGARSIKQRLNYNDGNVTGYIEHTYSITMGNVSPVADYATTTTPVSSPKATFDTAGISFDPDGTISNYAWTITKGGVTMFSKSGATATSIDYLPPETGTYIVTLTVTDNLGATAQHQHSFDWTVTPGGGGGAVGPWGTVR